MAWQDESTRTCRECRKEFRVSSGHLSCPGCRYLAYKDRCACGKGKARPSGTCDECVPRSGPESTHWRGGRTVHKAGYTMVWMPEHPRANTGPYVFEHIVVMEAMIGRALAEGENVHHRNGVKDDNRPENLELWTRPQPPGIRVVDAVAWARQILDRYGDLVPTTDESSPPAE